MIKNYIHGFITKEIDWVTTNKCHSFRQYKPIKRRRITTYYRSKWTDNRLTCCDVPILVRPLETYEDSAVSFDFVRKDVCIMGHVSLVVPTAEIHTSWDAFRRDVGCYVEEMDPQYRTEKPNWRFPFLLLTLFSLRWMCKQGHNHDTHARYVQITSLCMKYSYCLMFALIKYCNKF